MMFTNYEGTPENPLPCGCIFPDTYRCALYRKADVQYCECDCHRALLTPWGVFQGEERKSMIETLERAIPQPESDETH